LHAGGLPAHAPRVAVPIAGMRHLSQPPELVDCHAVELSVDRVCRYDLFNVRVRAATFAENGMMYRVHELWEAPPGNDSGEPATIYRGPKPTLLARPNGHTWPELLVLTAPGILEVRSSAGSRGFEQSLL
jgi:hypothetical protein